MGSGGMVVLDEDDCMVDVAKCFLSFTKSESCGKCPPCRIGTWQMYELLDKITSGQGEKGDIELLEKMGKMVVAGSLCGLGNSAPSPVLSTIKYFREEYEEHVNDKYCRAKRCQGWVRPHPAGALHSLRYVQERPAPSTPSWKCGTNSLSTRTTAPSARPVTPSVPRRPSRSRRGGIHVAQESNCPVNQPRGPKPDFFYNDDSKNGMCSKCHPASSASSTLSRSSRLSRQVREKTRRPPQTDCRGRERRRHVQEGEGPRRYPGAFLATSARRP